MNNYDKALAQRKIADSVRRGILLATGKDPKDGLHDHQNDKHQYSVWQGVNRDKPELLNDDWTPAVMYLNASYGYYGSSSGYSAMSEDLAFYTMKAIDSMMPRVGKLAIELAEVDAVKAEELGRKEAQSVLEKLGGLDKPVT